MKKKNVKLVFEIDFRDQTPDMLLKSPKTDPLYERAFLQREAPACDEFGENTTAWD